jgi:hypothetical protein
MTTKVEEAVALAQQIFGLGQQLRKPEKAMTLAEYIAYVDGTFHRKTEK